MGERGADVSSGAAPGGTRSVRYAMKYLGSKRWMLANGLGSLLRREVRRHERFVDLFCGGASVSWFIATLSEVPVLAVDLQRYATTLADAVLLRNQIVDLETLRREF